MDVPEKLDILARDAQYDLSCACGTKNNAEHRQKTKEGNWLYPVTVASGGVGIMLKTLMTNACSNDCRYCPLRKDHDSPRIALRPDELAGFFMALLAKRPLLGVFLSSGVCGTADATMDRLAATAEILRRKYRYRGYIHIKIIPGASEAAIDQVLSLASAVSLNIETPGNSHFSKLSAQKRYQQDIIEPLKYISSRTAPGSRYARMCKTSQFIVGASDETDREILAYSWGMYKRLGFDRLYFSAYQAGLGDPSIPGEQRRLALLEQAPPPERLLPDLSEADGNLLIREHRLYQADFLFRKYRFSFDDLLFTSTGNLDLSKDPKQLWAEAHPEFYPVSLSYASREDLLRVPGLGPSLAERIVKERDTARIGSIDSIRMPVYLREKARPYVGK